MISRRDMIAATAAALALPLLRCSPRSVGFLTPGEYALLDELTELIIPTDAHSPGARAAKVAGYIDARLAESLDPEWQRKWREGLRAVETKARTTSLTAVLEAGGDFFNELKGMTVFGYYTSKVGIHDDQEYQGNVLQTGDYAGYDAT